MLGIILFDDLGIPHPAGGPKQAAFTKGGDKTLGHNNSKNSNKRQIKRGGQVRYVTVSSSPVRLFPRFFVCLTSLPLSHTPQIRL